MTRIQNTPTLSLAGRGPILVSRRTALFLAAMLFIGTLALAAVVFGPRAESPAAATQVTGEVVDGWFPAIDAANRAQAAGAAVDGWASYLLVDEPPVVDGWAAALLRPEPKIVDGWAARYLVDDED